MLIILNGPQNAGKTTIAKLLQARIPRLAHIEVDNLREFVRFMDGKEAFPLSIENAILVAKNFARKNLDIIITYIFSEGQLKSTVKQLEETGKQVHVFTFAPALDKALTNRGTRELEEYEKERIKHHYSINIHKPSLGIIIDNTHQTPEETAKIILDNLKTLQKTWI